jgi:hypothetical protein
VGDGAPVLLLLRLRVGVDPEVEPRSGRAAPRTRKLQRMGFLVVPLDTSRLVLPLSTHPIATRAFILDP